VLLLGCAGPDSDSTPEVYFPLDLSDYEEVRACRVPGEHSGLGAFSVWGNEAAVAAFDAIWSDPPTRDTLPAGAIVVKAAYAGDECQDEALDHWVAMKKEPGFDPDHGDWRWQEVDSDGRVLSDGKTQSCIDCHAGPESSTCTGYGASNGRDYLCTEP
jgi:hypothetical protein